MPSCPCVPLSMKLKTMQIVVRVLIVRQPEIFQRQGILVGGTLRRGGTVKLLDGNYAVSFAAVRRCRNAPRTLQVDGSRKTGRPYQQCSHHFDHCRTMFGLGKSRVKIKYLRMGQKSGSELGRKRRYKVARYYHVHSLSVP